MVKLEIAKENQSAEASADLFDKKTIKKNASTRLSAEEWNTSKKLNEAGKNLIGFYSQKQSRFIQFFESKNDLYQNLEAARKAGASLAGELQSSKIGSVILNAESPELLIAYAEGLALASYIFQKHKTEKEKVRLKNVYLEATGLKKTQVAELQYLTEGVELARNLINDPVSHLSADNLAGVMLKEAEANGIKAEVLNQNKIRSLKMGGLLAVNAGSLDPATFTILEYKPANSVNKKPIVLVGKGVVFDTGGLTLKPTPGSMDQMKSDMAGAAAVIGTMVAAAKAKLPVHVVGLVPATDNRPGERAIAPGDVITISDGTTVEVLNTDAEGRLILADALHYAKKYKPELVIDLATLTGSAARAIGHYGIVAFGTAPESEKAALKESGKAVYERLVEFPLWSEYGELLKSDIADLKNVSSGASAGAITAAKFLEHFTDYPWIHLDIAGPAFLTGSDSYRGKNATGVGVRLLFNFLKNKRKK